MPEIISGKDGQLSLSGNVLKVIPGDAEIIINGLTVGMCSKDQKIRCLQVSAECKLRELDL